MSILFIRGVLNLCPTRKIGKQNLFIVFLMDSLSAKSFVFLSYCRAVKKVS